VFILSLVFISGRANERRDNIELQLILPPEQTNAIQPGSTDEIQPGLTNAIQPGPTNAIQPGPTDDQRM